MIETTQTMISHALALLQIWVIFFLINDLTLVYYYNHSFRLFIIFVCFGYFLILSTPGRNLCVSPVSLLPLCDCLLPHSWGGSPININNVFFVFCYTPVIVIVYCHAPDPHTFSEFSFYLFILYFYPSDSNQRDIHDAFFNQL